MAEMKDTQWMRRPARILTLESERTYGCYATMTRVEVECANGLAKIELLTKGEEDAPPEEASRATVHFKGFETKPPEDPDRHVSPLEFLLGEDDDWIPYTMTIQSEWIHKEDASACLTNVLEQLHLDLSVNSL